MTVVRVKGFKIFKDRHGKMRAYHRATRKPVDLLKSPLGSAAFFAECARIAELAKVMPTAKAGTLGALVASYKAHAAFTELAPNTRRGYQMVFDYLRPIDDTPLHQFNPPLIVGIRDKALLRGRRFANLVKAVLSLTFSWGVERGLMDTNPAKGVKNIRRARGLPDANRPWSDAERHVVLEHAPKHMLPALGLMMFTGMGPGDSLKLPRTFYKHGTIATSRAKTGEPIFWPMPKPLRDILDKAPKHDAITLCANSEGKPWTVSGFRASWRKLRIKLEQQQLVGPGLTLYGLRHTVAVILRECGFDERTIADALGQRTIEMARHYAKGADLKEKMRKVAKEFGRAVNKRRTKLSNPSENLSNLARRAKPEI